MRTKVARALISVYDKSGLVDLASGLVDLGVELISSGGTAEALRDAGIPVTSVEEVTGMPEMLGGRVKTLHPRIHGGILADRGLEQHRSDLAASGIDPIDLVVVNLYPFLDKPGIETIDVGGPTMVRAAAKNHAWVGVVTSSTQYGEVLDELRANDCTLGLETRARLALDAFARTSAYDAAIVRWLQSDEVLPPHVILPLERVTALRYGENPHQTAARYRVRNAPPGWIDLALQHGGKELSYINLLDADAAWSLVHRFTQPACVVVKHANPCGVALGSDDMDAYRRAFDCDQLSAFGGVVAVNRPLTRATAEAIAEVFTEVVIAPGYEDAAMAKLAEKANLRILEAPVPSPGHVDLRPVGGGFLLQEVDSRVAERDTWKLVTKAVPTEDQWRDLELAWVVCAAVTSNAIVLARDGQAVGIGAGQQSRVHSTEIAVRKAEGRARGGACASDAFFPFRDGIDAAAASGVGAIVQPGGSVRDEEVIAAADEHGIAMVFTGKRHFRH